MKFLTLQIRKQRSDHKMSWCQAPSSRLSGQDAFPSHSPSALFLPSSFPIRPLWFSPDKTCSSKFQNIFGQALVIWDSLLYPLSNLSLSPARLLNIFLLLSGQLSRQFRRFHGGPSSAGPSMLHPHHNTDFRIYVDSAVSAPSNSTSLMRACKAFPNPPHSRAQLRLLWLGHRLSLLGLLMVSQRCPSHFCLWASVDGCHSNWKLPFSSLAPVVPTAEGQGQLSIPHIWHLTDSSAVVSTMFFPFLGLIFLSYVFCYSSSHKDTPLTFDGFRICVYYKTRFLAIWLSD